MAKTYATDSLPTRQIKNTGEKIQYYAEHTHTAIIDKETYSAVQRLREKRKLDVKYNDDYQPNILKREYYVQTVRSPFNENCAAAKQSGCVEFIIIAKTIAPLSQLKKWLSTVLSAACTTNLNTTETPSSHKCSPTSKNPLQPDALERGCHLPQQENIRHTQSGSIPNPASTGGRRRS